MFIMEKDLKLNEWQFAQRKHLPYEAKIHLSRLRIQDWYDSHDGDVYVSFSGGLDSTVLVDLVRKTVGRVPLIFVNTGLEYRKIVSFIMYPISGSHRMKDFGDNGIITKMGATYMMPSIRNRSR